MVANINLPAAQLQIAMGIPLHRIRDIRILYNQDPEADNMIDFTDPKYILFITCIESISTLCFLLLHFHHFLLSCFPKIYFKQVFINSILILVFYYF